MMKKVAQSCLAGLEMFSQRSIESETLELQKKTSQLLPNLPVISVDFVFNLLLLMLMHTLLINFFYHFMERKKCKYWIFF